MPQSALEEQYTITVALQESVLVSKNFQVGCHVETIRLLLTTAPTDQYVIPGNIIVRQRGTLFHPGQHVRRPTPSIVMSFLNFPK